MSFSGNGSGKSCTDGSHGHRYVVCVLAAQNTRMPPQVALCMQKHARHKSSSWTWLMEVTDECQMFRCTESSCLAQQPIADEEWQTDVESCVAGWTTKDHSRTHVSGVTSRRRTMHDVLASPFPNPAVLN